MTGGIVTPEAILLEFAEAGLGSRALGFLVDLAVRGGILWGLLTVLGLIAPFASAGLVFMVLTVTALLIFVAYPVVCETLWNGRTVGKMLVGLRVVTVEGAPARFRHAMIRATVGLAELWVALGAPAILAVLGTSRSQRLGDLAAGTIVIRERKEGAHAQPILFPTPPGWESYAASLDVSGVDEQTYVLVRSYLLRVHELGGEARLHRGDELARLVASLLRVDVPTGHRPETFLQVVAAAYQRRHGGPGAATQPDIRLGAGPPGTVPPPVWQEDQPPPVWGSTSSPT